MNPRTRTLVGDVMTTNPAAVREDTPFKEIVTVLRDYRVSGVPVLDSADRVVGVVSAADLLLKEVDPVPRDGSFFETRRHRAQRRKAAGTTAAELMTTPAVTVTEPTTVQDAATTMHSKRVKRLPVIDTVTGRLVGIVSRSDLLSVFGRADPAIRQEVLDKVIAGEFLMTRRDFAVTVHHGVVDLRGQVERQSMIPALVEAVRRVEGVVDVRHRLAAQTDDLVTRFPPGA